jgi:hypothetical protein
MYKVSVAYMWKESSTGVAFKARMQLNDTTNLFMHQARPTSTATGEAYAISSFAFANLTSGNHFIDLDYCSEKTSATAYIWNCFLEMNFLG